MTSRLTNSSKAIAAMHEDEPEPWLVMSRNKREQLHRLLQTRFADEGGL